MEVCINECGVVLDSRWEQINWLDDRGHTGGQTRQLAARQWTGQTRAGCWMTSPSTRSVNGEDGLDGK